MTNTSFETRIAAIGADGYVTADEVLFLRRSVFTDGVGTADELVSLFALSARAPEGDPEWLQFFSEAAADYYLYEEEPIGYLTGDEFVSLQKRLETHGGTNGPALTLLIKLMELAVETPEVMSLYVGERLKAPIVKQEDGPSIDKTDIMLIKRFLFAAGGDGNVAVTRAEAELLFDINDAVGKNGENAAWTEVFIQGIVNHLMAHLGYQPPSREEAFRRDAWMRDQSINIGGFFKRMAASGFSAFRHATNKPSVYAEHNAQREIAAEEAADITGQEASWLAQRIGRDGAFDGNERDLIERIKTFEADLPESLKTLLNRAA